MPKYSVMINWTQTIERSAEIEVSGKDEEAAQEKAEAKIQKALENFKVPLVDVFPWDETNTDDSFEYEASEA